MKAFKTTSLADQVFERLENDIIHGVYPKGEILTELRLVEQLGVSRTPIREALRRLEQERLIEDTGKGSIVLGITEADLMDIMNIRHQVEALAAYYAAKNATKEDLQELREILDLQDFYYAKRDGDNLQKMDDRFHDCVCIMSRRNVIRDTLVPLHRKTRRFRRAIFQDNSRLDRTIKEHLSIYNAIAAGDSGLASKLTADHIANAKENMMERFGNNG